MAPISFRRTQSERRSKFRLRLRRISWLRIANGRRLIPNLFTLGNAIFGFSSIIWASSGHFVAASYFILLGAIMDGLDGRIARLTRGTSELGLQLDSLCDAISFCMAPAFVTYAWHLKYGGTIGFCASSLYLGLGLLRLARFNVTHLQQNIHFIGLPTTLAGCFLATMLINTRHFVASPTLTTAYIILTVTLAILMISTVPFPTFKQIPLPRKIVVPTFVLLFGTIIILGLTRVLLMLFMGYFGIALVQILIRKLKHLKHLR